MNSSNQYLGGRATSKLSCNRVLGGLNILRHFGLDLQNVLPLHFRRNRISAFTLSEVLITLGIIGVVAVLVMGLIIPQIQDRQNIAKWKKEYALISSIFQSAVAENIQICSNEAHWDARGGCDPGVNQFKTYSDDFVEYFMSKLKIIDYCVGGSLFGPAEKACTKGYKWAGFSYGTSSSYKTMAGGNINNYSFSQYAFLLNDGAVVYLGGAWGGPYITVDVNGAANKPNVIGKDFFAIEIRSNIKTNVHTAKPVGAQGTQDWNNATSGASGCSKDIGSQSSSTIYKAAGAGCSARYIGNY